MIVKHQLHRGASVTAGLLAFAGGIFIYVWVPKALAKQCPDRLVCLPEGWAWFWYLVVALLWLGLLVLAIAFEKLLGRIAPLKQQEAEAFPYAGSKGQHEHPMWLLFTTLWVLWAVMVIGGEFFQPAAEIVAGREDGALTDSQKANYWLAIIISLICIEAMGLIKKEYGGDTLSEQVWGFIHGEVTRAGIALGLVSLVLIRAVELGRKTTGEVFGLDIGRLMLALGIGGWLFFHFIGREQKRHHADRGTS